MANESIKEEDVSYPTIAPAMNYRSAQLVTARSIAHGSKGGQQDENSNRIQQAPKFSDFPMASTDDFLEDSLVFNCSGPTVALDEVTVPQSSEFVSSALSDNNEVVSSPVPEISTNNDDSCIVVFGSVFSGSCLVKFQTPISETVPPGGHIYIEGKIHVVSKSALNNKYKIQLEKDYEGESCLAAKILIPPTSMQSQKIGSPKDIKVLKTLGIDLTRCEYSEMVPVSTSHSARDETMSNKSPKSIIREGLRRNGVRFLAPRSKQESEMLNQWMLQEQDKVNKDALLRSISNKKMSRLAVMRAKARVQSHISEVEERNKQIEQKNAIERLNIDDDLIQNSRHNSFERIAAYKRQLELMAQQKEEEEMEMRKKLESEENKTKSIMLRQKCQERISQQIRRDELIEKQVKETIDRECKMKHDKAEEAKKKFDKNMRNIIRETESRLLKADEDRRMDDEVKSVLFEEKLADYKRKRHRDCGLIEGDVISQISTDVSRYTEIVQNQINSDNQNRNAFRSNPIQPDVFRSNSIQPDVFKSNPIQSEVFKSNPIQSEVFKSNPIQPDVFKSNPIQSEVFKSNPIQPEVFKSNSILPDSSVENQSIVSIPVSARRKHAAWKLAPINVKPYIPVPVKQNLR